MIGFVNDLVWFEWIRIDFALKLFEIWSKKKIKISRMSPSSLRLTHINYCLIIEHQKHGNKYRLSLHTKQHQNQTQNYLLRIRRKLYGKDSER